MGYALPRGTHRVDFGFSGRPVRLARTLAHRVSPMLQVRSQGQAAAQIRHRRTRPGCRWPGRSAENRLPGRYSTRYTQAKPASALV